MKDFYRHKREKDENKEGVVGQKVDWFVARSLSLRALLGSMGRLLDQCQSGDSWLTGLWFHFWES